VKKKFVYDPKTGSFEKKSKTKSKKDGEYHPTFGKFDKSSISGGIFGVIVYVLLIIFCIYFLGDYGYERGPRFFGDPG